MMNLQRLMVWAVIALWVSSLSMQAQGPSWQTEAGVYLSLEQALQQAAQSNRNLRMAQLDIQKAGADMHQTDAAFLPHLSVSYQAVTTNNPLNAFGFLLQQRGVTPQHFTPEQMNHPGATQNYGASADLQLPLFNPEMIHARQGAKLQEKMYRYKAEYAQDYLRFEVQKAYTQLQFAYQSRQVLQGTLRDVQGIYQAVENFYAQGLVQKSDVLNAQVQVNTLESALTRAESHILNASDGLRLLLNQEEEAGQDTPILTDSLVQRFSPQTSASLSLARADILAMQSAVAATKAQARSAAWNFLPKINAFGSYQFNDSKLFGFKENSYLAGISLTWTIFSGNQNRSKWRSANFQHRKMQLELEDYQQKSRLEVDRNHRELQVLQREIEQQTTRVAQAEESLRILRNRHQEGLASTTDLLTQQAFLSQQQLSLAQAIMNYNVALYYQELLTSMS